MNQDNYLYNFDNLLADVGGYLGLLLGASIVSFYENVAIMLGALLGKKKFCSQGK